MLLYLDLCSIQRPLDDKGQLRVKLEADAVVAILALCESGRAKLLSSDALVYESGRNPDPVRKAHALEVLGNASQIIELSPAIEHRAEELQNLGLKPLDALHFACAEEAKADYFCTCDDRLLRHGRALHSASPKTVTPIELVGELGI